MAKKSTLLPLFWRQMKGISLLEQKGFCTFTQLKMKCRGLASEIRLYSSKHPWSMFALGNCKWQHHWEARCRKATIQSQGYSPCRIVKSVSSEYPIIFDQICLIILTPKCQFSVGYILYDDSPKIGVISKETQRTPTQICLSRVHELWSDEPPIKEEEIKKLPFCRMIVRNRVNVLIIRERGMIYL